jgi:hypothetical protein
MCIGCQGEIGTDRTETTINPLYSSPAIENYLDRRVGSKGFGGTVYCAYDILDSEGERFYLWTVCQEYYLKNGKLEAGTGGSFPVALTVRQDGDKIEVRGYQKPRDGSLYSADLKAIFSQKALAAANSISNDRIARLQNLVKQKARVP